MKRLIIPFLAATLPIANHSAYATPTEPDTTDIQQLGEVVVQADRQRASTTSNTYIPSSVQKSAAQNAIDLLRRMAIPQIRVNPSDDSVTDNAGGTVAIYINYLEATSDEMTGLRTADVLRVEYLEFPTDPRFRGAQRVINIIVREYAYGGYTKLTADESVLIGLVSRTSVFSKFTYKKMTYDLYAGANNVDIHHTGRSSEADYNLATPVTRTETLESSHCRQNTYPVTFRATYNSEKVQIRNLLGYTYAGEPINEYSGRLQFTPSAAQDYSFVSKNPNHSNSLSYSGTYFFSLPSGFSVDFSPSFSYTHGNDYTTYATTAASDIYRHAREDAYSYRFNLYLRKRLGDKHSLMVGGNGGDYVSRLAYLGDSPYRDKFSNPFAAGMAGYNFATQKVSLSLDAGVCWEGNDINGEKIDDVYPFVHVNVRYVPNKKNSFSAYIQYATNSPVLSMKSDDLLRENELMYFTGNPKLENCRHTTVNLAYTWMPRNSFGMSVYANYMRFYDRQLRVYLPFDDGKALLRTYVNDGDFSQGAVGIAVKWQLFNDKLQLYASPSQKFYRSTGIYAKSCNPFSVYLQASYYLDKVYFEADYMNEQKSMESETPMILSKRNYHSFTVGWSNSGWNLRLSAINVFNRGWDASTWTIESPYYTERRTVVGISCHPRLSLKATYTYGYGKKISRGNEVGEQSGASSAILK